MPAEVEIKLQDLAKIALGTPELTSVNIAILQSLIEILLKKLNCQNETVSLNANESKHLEKILQTAKASPLLFNDENIEMITDKLQRVENLQDCVQNLEVKLNRHLHESKNNFNKIVFNWENWSSEGFEDLCTTCDPENEMACKILKNCDFLKKLLRRISAPMIERMFYFEEKIEKLNEEFTKFIEHAQEEYLKIHLLEKCMVEIETLRKKIQQQQSDFLVAMEEIQDMLDSKLDKIHMPALKKYIADNFQQIDEAINVLQKKQKCTRAAGIIMDEIRCMSCGEKNICSEVGEEATSLLPDVLLKSKSGKKRCGCLKKSKKSAFKSWIIDDSVKLQSNKELKDKVEEEKGLPKCRKAGYDFEFLEGSDGNLYRKG